MMYILNDYSINSQFGNVDMFTDSLLTYTIPLFNTMEEYNLKLLKSYHIFDSEVVDGMTISDILSIRNYPEIFKFKTLLYRLLLDNPYWESKDSNHDCIVEAFKRNAELISFEHDEYLSGNIEYMWEGNLRLIPNSYNKNQLIERLYANKTISPSQYLETKYSNIKSFCNIDRKNYFEAFIIKNNIKESEIDKIVRDLDDFMERYLNGHDLGELSKTIETNLYEFRTTIADSRKVRIFYCRVESKLIFLNGFIKKQGKTPENEKELGRKLRDCMINDVF